jgi:integration host factor subunit beta
MENITKKQLCERIADSSKLSRTCVRRIVQTFLDEIVRTLAAGHRLEFREFGVFETRVRAPRRGRNPKTSQPVAVPAKRTIRFKAGLRFRQALDRAGTPAVDAKASGRGAVRGAGRHATRTAVRAESPLVETRPARAAAGV